jgi:hypothetical protein
MNLASCVDDWSSTRTAGKLLAGTKHCTRRRVKTGDHPTPSVYSNGHRRPRGPLRGHADSAMPFRPSGRGTAASRAGPG